MATIRVTHSIGDLASDMRKIAVRAKPELSKIVRKNTHEGNMLARRFARERSGPHGKNAYKRLTSEMLSPLVGEYGWTGDASQIVGASWRNGPPNTDLPRSADVIGPKFANDVQDAPGKWFWPA
jgi:hypothetical protein